MDIVTTCEENPTLWAGFPVVANEHSMTEHWFHWRLYGHLCYTFSYFVRTRPHKHFDFIYISCINEGDGGGGGGGGGDDDDDGENDDEEELIRV